MSGKSGQIAPTTDTGKRDKHGAPQSQAINLNQTATGAMFSLQRQAGNFAVEALLKIEPHGGRPMSPDLRQDMEQRFARDFSQVRLHSDDDASASAEALAAKAYTVGDHIFFSKGRFSPDTRDGKRLLAHELAHVVQQSRGGPERPTRDGSGPLELAASNAAAAVTGAGGVISVQGASATGVACEPDEDVPWWKRLKKSASETVDKITVAPSKVVEKAEEKYEAAKQEAMQLADETKKKYEATKEDLTEKVKALNTKENREKVAHHVEAMFNPSVQIADATAAARKQTEAWAEKAEGEGTKGGPATTVNNFVKSADNFAQAWAKLDTEPTKKFTDAVLKDGFVAGVKAWQKSKDERLEDLTKNFKQAVNEYEDGKFETPPQALFDPAAHPTLSKIEQSIQGADETASKYRRQVVGGAAKAVWSMGSGIANIGVHPVNTVKGFGEMPSVPGMPNPAKDIGQVVGVLDDLVTSDKPAIEVFDEYNKKQQFDPKREFEKSKALLKGLGENYIEAAGYSIDPKTHKIVEHNPENARWGEIPGLLLVDVGSFFIPGGAGTKGSKLAGAAGKVGETGKVLGTLGEAEKALQVGADLSKANDIAKFSDEAKALAQATKTGDEAKAAEAARDLGKEPVKSSLDKVPEPLDVKPLANDVPPVPTDRAAAPPSKPSKLPHAAPPVEPAKLPPPGPDKPNPFTDPHRPRQSLPKLDKYKPGELKPSNIADYRKPPPKGGPPPGEPHVQPVLAEVAQEVAEEGKMAVGQTHGVGGPQKSPLSIVKSEPSVASASGKTRPPKTVSSKPSAGPQPKSTPRAPPKGQRPRAPNPAVADEYAGRSKTTYPAAEWDRIRQLEERFPKLKDAELRPKARPKTGGEAAFEEKMQTTQGDYSLTTQEGRRPNVKPKDRKFLIEFDNITHDGWVEEIKIEQSLERVDELMVQLRKQADFAQEYGLKGVEYRIEPPAVAAEVESRVAQEGLKNVFRR